MSEIMYGEDVNSDQPPIRAFLSYAHADDSEFGVVDPLVKKIKAFTRAKSGRSLDIFVDRESIGWGSDWRTSISTSVESATVFIPLMSANYLDSVPCREEFLAFHSKAQSLGVTELLLPILLFKSPLFGEDTADEVAQIAERLQYKLIEAPLLRGYQSPEWFQCTLDLAESLLGAVAQAETSLLRVTETSPASPSQRGSSEAAPVAEEESGMAELMEALEGAANTMAAATEGLTAAIEELGEVPAKVGDMPNEATAKQVTIWTLRLAHEFRTPAEALEENGRELFEATKSVDESLLRMQRLADSVDDLDFNSSMREGRRSMVESFGDLGEVMLTMEELLDSMKPAETLSVPLRKSLQPARRGITAVRDSLQLIESWKAEFAVQGIGEGT